MLCKCYKIDKYSTKLIIIKKAVEPVCRGCAVILNAAVGGGAALIIATVWPASSKSQCRHGAMADPEG